MNRRPLVWSSLDELTRERAIRLAAWLLAQRGVKVKGPDG